MEVDVEDRRKTAEQLAEGALEVSRGVTGRSHVGVKRPDDDDEVDVHEDGRIAGELASLPNQSRDVVDDAELLGEDGGGVTSNDEHLPRPPVGAPTSTSPAVEQERFSPTNDGRRESDVDLTDVVGEVLKALSRRVAYDDDRDGVSKSVEQSGNRSARMSDTNSDDVRTDVIREQADDLFQDAATWSKSTARLADEEAASSIAMSGEAGKSRSAGQDTPRPQSTIITLTSAASIRDTLGNGTQQLEPTSQSERIAVENIDGHEHDARPSNIETATVTPKPEVVNGNGNLIPSAAIANQSAKC